jgi:hypothetical protein
VCAELRELRNPTSRSIATGLRGKGRSTFPRSGLWSRHTVCLLLHCQHAIGPRLFFDRSQCGSSLAVFGDFRRNNTENRPDSRVSGWLSQFSDQDSEEISNTLPRKHRLLCAMGAASNNLDAAEEHASGAEKYPQAAFRPDSRPDFPAAEEEVATKEGDDRRRSLGMERGEKQMLGGSDTTLSGLSAAQRLRHRGSLRSSPGRDHRAGYDGRFKFFEVGRSWTRPR